MREACAGARAKAGRAFTAGWDVTAGGCSSARKKASVSWPHRPRKPPSLSPPEGSARSLGPRARRRPRRSGGRAGRDREVYPHRTVTQKKYLHPGKAPLAHIILKPAVTLSEVPPQVRQLGSVPASRKQTLAAPRQRARTHPFHSCCCRLLSPHPPQPRPEASENTTLPNSFLPSPARLPSICPRLCVAWEAHSWCTSRGGTVSLH